MVTLVKCFWRRIPSASHSWQAMSPSQQQRALSVSLTKANRVRQKPLRVILNGLGKDAAQIIARINGFTYVETEYDYYTGEAERGIPQVLTPMVPVQK